MKKIMIQIFEPDVFELAVEPGVLKACGCLSVERVDAGIDGVLYEIITTQEWESTCYRAIAQYIIEARMDDLVSDCSKDVGDILKDEFLSSSETLQFLALLVAEYFQTQDVLKERLFYRFNLTELKCEVERLTLMIEMEQMFQQDINCIFKELIRVELSDAPIELHVSKNDSEMVVTTGGPFVLKPKLMEMERYLAEELSDIPTDIFALYILSERMNATAIIVDNSTAEGAQLLSDMELHQSRLNDVHFHGLVDIPNE